MIFLAFGFKEKTIPGPRKEMLDNRDIEKDCDARAKRMSYYRVWQNDLKHATFRYGMRDNFTDLKLKGVLDIRWKVVSTFLLIFY
jgi:hypothetical protein